MRIRIPLLLSLCLPAAAVACGPIGFMSRRPSWGEWAVHLGIAGGLFMAVLLSTAWSLTRPGREEGGRLPLVRPTFLLLQAGMLGAFLFGALEGLTRGRPFQMDLIMATMVAVWMVMPLAVLATLWRLGQGIRGLLAPTRAAEPEAAVPKKVEPEAGSPEETAGLMDVSLLMILRRGIRGAGVLIGVYLALSIPAWIL